MLNALGLWHSTRIQKEPVMTLPMTIYILRIPSVGDQKELRTQKWILRDF
jgi:hypothetical protein